MMKEKVECGMKKKYTLKGVSQHNGGMSFAYQSTKGKHFYFGFVYLHKFMIEVI